MRFRATVGILVVTTTCLVAGGAPAHASTTCTWGGTPAAPTGRVTMSPGATNNPSTEPIDFTATGVLAGGGGCNGQQFTFIGQMNTGATCAFSTFQGAAMGLPGVKRFAGVAPVGILPARLYDKDGNIVGSENAQVDTLANAPSFPNCNTPEGFSGGNFSSVIELFGDRW
jgi:hypothetical protein